MINTNSPKNRQFGRFCAQQGTRNAKSNFSLTEKIKRFIFYFPPEKAAPTRGQTQKKPKKNPKKTQKKPHSRMAVRAGRKRETPHTAGALPTDNPTAAWSRVPAANEKPHTRPARSLTNVLAEHPTLPCSGEYYLT